ncbi:MAG: ABC transporter ATP-binding protein [Methanobacteriota archaeon]
MEDKSLSVGKSDSPSVRVEGVWKTYDGAHYILRDVSLSVPAGEFVLITGRSGSGKTTLLNLLGCMDVPSKGRICLNGYDTGKLTQRELARARLRKIGMVFQTHNLISDLTVLENVMLPLKIAGGKDARERACALLRTFDLDIYMDRFPSEISGGERQRVAVARALANTPMILLADEPTASLDLDNCTTVIEAFKKANREFGTTVVIASHDPVMEDHVESIYSLKKGDLKEER